jgi:hypothetical protein
VQAPGQARRIGRACQDQHEECSVDTHPADRHEPGWYEICLQGRLDERWSTWFDGLTLTAGVDTGGGVCTVLRGQVVDQAALHGLLARLRDVGLPLVSLTRVEPAPPEAMGTSSGEHPR